MLRDIARRGHDIEIVNTEPALHQRGIRQRLLVAANGDVEALLHDIDETIGHMQRQRQLGVAHRQFPEMRRQRELRRRHRGRQPHGAAWLTQSGADDILGILRLDHRGPGMLEEIAAQIGQRETARCAMDQPGTEPGFKFGHAFADRRFRNAEPARGCSEAAAIDSLDEELQIVEVHLSRPYLWTLERKLRLYRPIVRNDISIGSISINRKE